MNQAICDELLQRAYDAYQNQQQEADSQHIDFCDEELNWLANVGYIEITYRWVHGGKFRITERGLQFKKPTT